MPHRKDPYETDPEFKQEWFGGTAISGHNGGRDRRLDHLLQGLILAGILALVGIVWRLQENVTHIGTLVTAKVEQYDREIGRLDKTLDRHDERLTSLEQGRRTGNGQPDHR